MPGPLAVAAITAAGGLINSAINAGSTANLNRKNRQFAREQYATQRAHALQDWESQNTYNSPVEQMKRLKAAGLNPNLVYGNGADAQAGSINSSSFPTPNTEAFKQNENIPGNALSKFYEVSVQQQQLRNMEATEHLIDAQTRATLANAGLHEIDLDVKKWMNRNVNDEDDSTTPHDQELSTITPLKTERLSKYHEQMSKEGLARERYEMAMTQDEIMTATKQSTITAAAEKIISMRIAQSKNTAEINNLKERLKILKSEGILKQLDAEFAEQLHGRWDNYIIKILSIILGGK